MELAGTGCRSLAEVYGHGAYAPFLQALRLAGSQPVALVRFSQPAGDFPDPPTDDFTLAINERGSGRMRFDVGAGRCEAPFRRGGLVLKAPGVATHFANDAPHQKSFVSLPAPLVAQILAEANPAAAAPGFGRLHAGVFRSGAIAQLLDLMWAEGLPDSPHGRLFSDGAVLSLVALLLRLADPPGAPTPAASLSPARLSRVRDWTMAHLAEPFGIADMAASIRLSPFHFSRAFKLATGQTPRAFATACRVAHAKDLLDADLPLAEIAQACGFADQAHFTTSFRRATGVTPGQYRRVRR